MLFLRKTDETIWKAPFLKEPPLISEQIFHAPPLCPNFKNEIPPPPLILGGGGESMQPLDQDQQNSKKTDCRLPIIIFPLTPKGFISPESFLNFFLNLYVYSNMLAEKFQIYRVKIIANTFVSQKIESVQFYSYLQVFIIIIPQAAGDCPFLRNSVF